MATMPRHALPILSMFVMPQRLQLTRNGMRGAGFANSHTVQPDLIFQSRVTTFANKVTGHLCKTTHGAGPSQG